MALTNDMLPDPLPAEPLQVAQDWVSYATQRMDQPNPNAMVLATVDSAGHPSARVVLCKQIAPDPGYIVFYTNYQSRKGMELAATGRAAIVMHWDHLHRQVRIEGAIVRSPAAESDAYFASRPWQSRLGAWASAQSQPVKSRAALHESLEAMARRFETPSPAEPSAHDYPVPRPPHWGGYRLWADAVELWMEGDARIHDRARWNRTLNLKDDGLFEPGPWTVTRLQP